MSRLTAIRDALAKSPNNPSLLLLHGHACVEELQLDQAVEMYERVLDIDPDQIEAQLGIARALLFRGDSSGAAVRVERVLQNEDDCAQAHLLMSRILLSEGDRTRALEQFEKAVRIDAAVTDVGLEQELGRSGADVRKSIASALLQSDAPFNSPSDTLPPPGDMGSDMNDDFLDEPFDDWRPETFFTPGDTERTKVNFESVGGMEELKEEIRIKIIYPLQHPDLYKAYGRKAGGGILIFGPPGCGKTLMLRAVAGEVGCNYFAVGLHEIFDPYFGSSERNLHQIFETARSNSPCVLVFDELDSLAVDRRNVRESPMRNLVNQFLSELDGLRADQSRILVIGATNSPWNLDPAFRRPGRFDQTVFVPPPDKPARAQIIELLAKDKPIAHLDVATLSKMTKGFTGADLKYVFDRAAELALSEAVHTNRPVPISMELLTDIAKNYHPATDDWFEGARPHVQQSAQDGLYTDVRKFLNTPSGARNE
jgi:AAA+ superfamily predicted ATPase